MARVLLDLPNPHLDRPFDYLVPDGMSARAVPGARVRVRFAGRDVDAFVLERVAASDHPGRLSPLTRVASAEPVLSPDVARLARAVADRYAGVFADVVRLAVPPRHAATEEAPAGVTEPSVPRVTGSSGAGAEPDADPWAAYPAGPAFLARLRSGGAPRAVWTALPGARHWARCVVAAVAAARSGGRGAVVVLPDGRDVAVVGAELEAAGIAAARLEADLGPAARYREFLRCLRGEVRVAVGTRAAAFAPVADPGLLVIWDDGDPVHAEARAPYPHAREVLRLRAEQSGAAVLIGGWAMTPEAAHLLEQGWARDLGAERAVRRRRWASVAVADDGSDAPARVPTAAWRAVRTGLDQGPVLVQVPRTGYVPGLACGTCRRPARCPHCSGPVRLGPADRDASETPVGEPVRALSCGWCGRALPAWRCPDCQGGAVRARHVGIERTAEELGRAFPGVPVITSRPEAVPAPPERPALVLATPGIEPRPGGDGYAAAVLLDAGETLARPDLRAGEEALRRWLGAAALVRPGGRVVLCVPPDAASQPAVQALVRLDPAGFAARELADRAAAGLPPARVAVALTGERSAATAFVASVLGDTGSGDPAGHGIEVLGPIPVPDDTPRPHPEVADELILPVDEPRVRMVLRCPPASLAVLTRALAAQTAARSARRDRVVRVQVDPRDLG